VRSCARDSAEFNSTTVATAAANGSSSSRIRSEASPAQFIYGLRCSKGRRRRPTRRVGRRFSRGRRRRCSIRWEGERTSAADRAEQRGVRTLARRSGDGGYRHCALSRQWGARVSSILIATCEASDGVQNRRQTRSPRGPPGDETPAGDDQPKRFPSRASEAHHPEFLEHAILRSVSCHRSNQGDRARTSQFAEILSNRAIKRDFPAPFWRTARSPISCDLYLSRQYDELVPALTMPALEPSLDPKAPIVSNTIDVARC
jgi:hypothetical protein